MRRVTILKIIIFRIFYINLTAVKIYLAAVKHVSFLTQKIETFSRGSCINTRFPSKLPAGTTPSWNRLRNQNHTFVSSVNMHVNEHRSLSGDKKRKNEASATKKGKEKQRYQSTHTHTQTHTYTLRNVRARVIAF